MMQGYRTDGMRKNATVAVTQGMGEYQGSERTPPADLMLARMAG